MNTPLTIWCNAQYSDSVMGELLAGVPPHRLVFSQVRNKLNLAAGAPDPALEQADVAFGQPDPDQVIRLPRLKWVHLTTAGYTRYDTDAVRVALRSRGGMLTNSSSVYDEPCAQHALAMMLALSRQLPQCWSEQAATRSWKAAEHRMRCHLLEKQTALLVGFGAIARRLAELLAPFHMNLQAVRRTIRGDELVSTFAFDRLADLLSQADHVINVLPSNPSTEGIFDSALFARMKPTALFYNIGRGTTVDQVALQKALEEGRLGGAYLDVTDPEPLPPEHPLWRLPNCWITPHTAGGHADEFERLVRHFLGNLRRFTSGEAVLDRVI